MARKQSSTIWFQGNPHKEIYFNGHYHDKMYKGSQLIWQKLNDEYEKDMYYRIQDYSIYDGTTYFVGFLYKDVTGQDDVLQGVYIAKFNAEKMCLDMIHKIEVVSVYTNYLIHACKDGLVLIKYDYKFSEENTENQPYVGIAKYPIKQSSVFEKIGQNSFSEETTIFMPPFVKNETYNKPQFMVFGKDYYVKQIVVHDSNNYGYSSFVKYSYDGEIIKETPADDTIIARPNNEPIYHNVFSINGNLITWIDELYYNGKSSSKAISYNNELNDKKKYSLEPPEGYRFSSLKRAGSDHSKRFFALCNGNAYAIGQISTDSNPSKITRSIFELSEEKMSAGIQIPVNALVDTVDAIGKKLIVHVSSSRTRCFYLIEDGEIKNQYDSYNTANAYAYDEENIYLWGGVYRYVFDKNLSYIKFEQEKIRIIK